MNELVLGVVTPAAYLVACLVAVGLVVHALRSLRRGSEIAHRVVAPVLAVLLAADVVAYLIGEAVQAHFSARTSLPLALCNAAVLVAVAALLTRQRLLVELTWYVGLAGTIQAVVTPDLSSPFPHLVFFEYLVGHLGIVAAALVLVVGLRLAPRPGSWWRCLVIVAGYTALVGVVDWSSGADYMFLRRPPANATLLSVLGPFPYYIASATGVAFVLFVLLGAPFSPGLRARAFHLWSWAVTIAVGLVIWPAIFLVPRRFRWGLFRNAGWVLVHLLGIEVTISRPSNLATPAVYVANHESVVDGLILVLALPRPATIVVGGTIARHRIAGPFFRALDFSFVGPATKRSALDQIASLAAVLDQGHDLAGFPAGGLPSAGTCPRLRLGLFRAAALANCAVVPIHLRGTAGVIAPGTRTVRRGRIEVSFGEPRRADGIVHSSVIALARAVGVELDAPESSDDSRSWGREPMSALLSNLLLLQRILAELDPAATTAAQLAEVLF